jgi:hypothetical protein
MRRILRDHTLGLFFGAIFLATLAGQSLTGLAVYNQEQLSHGLEEIGWLRFVTSSAFAVDVAENWQSEYLQFFLFIAATIWLVQRGSTESKQVGKEGIGSEEEQLLGEFARPDSPAWAKLRGFKLWLLSNSLLLVMGAIFFASWFAQSMAGVTAFNEEQLRSLQDPLTWTQYIVSPDFWNRTLQNWQSEFLAVGSMVVLSIYLRQRGSPESKPTGEAHAATGVQS